jgi:NADH-quinone oxidoreductase subunit H
LVIPAGSIVAIKTSYGIPIIVTLISLIPIIKIAIGWASNSRFAYIGSVREAFMYFAYEIPLIIAVLAMILLYGSTDPYVVVEKQKIWGIALNPLAFLSFLIVTAMATSRLPFDIPEADQEIAFGPFVECSGILFGIVMTIVYEKLYLLCLLISILFLGGFQGPLIPLLGDLSPAIWLFIKALLLMMILVFLRSIYPRFRLDQALKIGWTSLLCVSLISLMIAILIRAGGIL